MSTVDPMISTKELLERAKINRRRFDYLRLLHNGTFPKPIKSIGNSMMWDVSAIAVVAALDKSIRKYSVAAGVE